jgi:hypothetical protein
MLVKEIKELLLVVVKEFGLCEFEWFLWHCLRILQIVEPFLRLVSNAKTTTSIAKPRTKEYKKRNEEKKEKRKKKETKKQKKKKKSIIKNT